DRLICLVGGKDAVAVAFDRNTGKRLWKALSLDSAEVGYSPPVIVTVGGTRQLIIWHPESCNGLDPATGKVYWTYPFAVKANLSVPRPRTAGAHLLLPPFYAGARLLQLSGGNAPSAKEVWRSRGRGERPNQTDKLHSIMPTPVVKDGYIYGVCSYGELR